MCSNRATSGYLYPLDKGFKFVHKPALYIKFEGIASVNFACMSGSAGASRSFDFEVEMKDGNAAPLQQFNEIRMCVITNSYCM